MSALPLVEEFVTPEAYLAAESASEVRHEYAEGAVYSMAGASWAHVTINANLVTALGTQLQGKDCQSYGSDRRLRLERGEASFYYYPDASVDCSGSREVEMDEPTVLFEILSSDSQRRDRVEKLANYKGIAALRVYVLIDQTTPAVTLFRRDEEGEWASEFLIGLGSTIELPEVGVRLPLANVYDKVF